MNRKIAIETMNDFGKRRIPFLFIIDFALKAPIVLKLKHAACQDIFFDINGITNYKRERKKKIELKFKSTPIAFTRYRAAFQKVQRHIGFGNTYLLNLTFPTKIKTNLTLKEIFHHSHAKYKLLFKNRFVVFSPEPFIRIKNQIVSSNPMKGTINASINNAKKIILADKKELAEHYTIVDLIRNDLSMVAKGVRVEQFRYIERIKTHENDLYQVSSKITGILPKNYRSKIGDIIFQLLPAGSVSGAPKMKTVEIIGNVEQYDRGYYTGIVGYYDGTTLDSGVMIRFIEKNNGSLIYKSGGGITRFSDMRSEYQELIDKVYVPIV